MSISKTFAYHKPGDAALEKITAIRQAYSSLKEVLDRECTASREKSVALTELETSAMWAVKAVVFNDKESTPEGVTIGGMAKAICALLLVLVCSTSYAQALPDQVDEGEVRRLGNVVQKVGEGPRSDGVDEYMEAMAPPASDADKWFVSVVTIKNCPACEKLKADWASSPDLKAWAVPGDQKASWAHFNLYNAADKSQQFRFTGLKIDVYPTILIQPPRTGKFGPGSTVVCQIAGYDGNAAKLSQLMSANVRAYVAKRTNPQPAPAPHQVSKRKAAGGMVSGWRQPAPFDPNSILPSPLLTPAVSPTPPPLVSPTPAVAPDAPSEPDSIPSTQELVVVMDDAGLDPAVHTRIRELADRWKKGTRVRYLDFASAKGRYPVKRDETPVVLATSDGRIEDKVSARLLPLLMPQLSISDLPWSSLLALLTGGAAMPVIVGLVVMLIKRVHAARAAAGTALLPDDVYQQLIDLLNSMAAKKAIVQSAEPLKPIVATLESTSDEDMKKLLASLVRRMEALEQPRPTLGPS